MNFGPKQPQEEHYLGFDFAARMQGEAIQSATVTAVDSCGLRQRKEVYNASATNTNKVKTI